MRASYALPGIFPPVRLGGRWLVDGALVNPVPVTAARAFGARVVIAVNLDADRFARGATIASHGSDPSDEPPGAAARNAAQRAFMGLARHVRRRAGASSARYLPATARPGFSTVMIEAFNIMQDRLTRMRLAGDPPDVHITPHIGHIGWLDFHRADGGDRGGQDRDGKSPRADHRNDRRARLERRDRRRKSVIATAIAGAQFVWHVSWAELQFNKHVVLAVALLVRWCAVGR